MPAGGASQLLMCLALAALPAGATTFEVGPGRPLQNINDVPWESLAAGDVVLIHARPEPYREKWTIAAVGTASAPVVVRGVPDALGTLPLIEAENGTTRPGIISSNENRGVVKVGRTLTPFVSRSEHVVVEGLHIRGARADVPFSGNSDAGVYLYNAAGIYLDPNNLNVTIRGCELDDNGSGAVINGENVDVIGNYFHDNGDPGGRFGHNLSHGALGGVIERNRFGPPCPTCLNANGVNHQGRGLVFRFNWLEGGSHLINVSSQTVPTDPVDAREVYAVYGNVLLQGASATGAALALHGQLAQPGPARGTLYVFHNTLRLRPAAVMAVVDAGAYQVAAYNNVVHAADGGLTLHAGGGALLIGGNLLPAGAGASAQVVDLGNNVVDGAPPFKDEAALDLRLSPTSAGLDSAVQLPPELAAFPVDREYVRHQADGPRLAFGRADPGAFESPWARRAPTTPLPARLAVGCGCAAPGDPAAAVATLLVLVAALERRRRLATL